MWRKRIEMPIQPKSETKAALARADNFGAWIEQSVSIGHER